TKTVDASQVFTTTAGRCAVLPAAACTTNAECAAGTFCNGLSGRCTLASPATCRASGDCPTGTECLGERVTVGFETQDLDDDGISHAVDQRPQTPNSARARRA